MRTMEIQAEWLLWLPLALIQRFLTGRSGDWTALIRFLDALFKTGAPIRLTSRTGFDEGYKIDESIPIILENLPQYLEATS